MVMFVPGSRKFTVQLISADLDKMVQVGNALVARLDKM